MRSKNVLYYGKDKALPERYDVLAGPLRAVFEDGDLRSIHYENHEVLRRIYVAVRDRNWGTVPNVLSNVRMDIGADSFHITYDVENKTDEIHFVWKAVIAGDRNGSISFSMQGIALATFMRNRIGFCVLHPATCAGTPCVVEHIDGAESKAMLPFYIVADQPVPPFSEMRGLSHQVAPGIWANVQFSGEVFEMEDQRNWTDASFKTFCTPLRIPYPVEVKEGSLIKQSIQLKMSGNTPEPYADAKKQSGGDRISTLTLDPLADPLPLPAIGLSAASHQQPLGWHEVERLKALHLDHIRIDIDLTKPEFQKALIQGIDEAQSLGLRIDFALTLSQDSRHAMGEFARSIAELKPSVRNWLIYSGNERRPGGTQIAEILTFAHRYLDGMIPGAKFAAGANTDLIFLQRNLPPLDQIDAVTFAIVPEVHAFDNASIVETLEAQPQVVATARHRANGLPVMISPITFKMRSNPYATTLANDVRADRLPAQVDERQMSLFAAGWTLGSISALAQCGTHSLTYYETSGWRGVMETPLGPPLPDLFQSKPSEVFPIYFVFAAVGEFADGEVIPCASSNPMIFNALVLKKAGLTRILLVNHTPTKQFIAVPASNQAAAIHRLTETNVETAMSNPEAFLESGGEEIIATNTVFNVEMSPYAISWIDA